MLATNKDMNGTPLSLSASFAGQRRRTILNSLPRIKEFYLLSFVCPSFVCVFFPAPTCDGFTGCAAISQNLVSNAGSVTCPQVPCTTQNCCTRMRWCASPVFFFVFLCFSFRWVVRLCRYLTLFLIFGPGTRWIACCICYLLLRKSAAFYWVPTRAM